MSHTELNISCLDIPRTDFIFCYYHVNVVYIQAPSNKVCN
jgi:hypothetical protein